MIAPLLTLIGPLVPWILGGLAAIVAYFGIKAKGAAEAKAKFQEQQSQATAKVQAQVAQAVSQDAQVDAKVEKQIVEIEKTEKPPVADRPKPGDIFEF